MGLGGLVALEGKVFCDPPPTLNQHETLHTSGYFLDLLTFTFFLFSFARCANCTRAPVLFALSACFSCRDVQHAGNSRLKPCASHTIPHKAGRTKRAWKRWTRTKQRGTAGGCQLDRRRSEEVVERGSSMRFARCHRGGVIGFLLSR